MKAVVLALTLFLASGAAALGAEDEPPRPPLRVLSGPSGISVQAQAVPLDEVLRELSRVTGVAVYFEAGLDTRVTRRPTSLALQDAKVEEAFRRVLRDVNFIVGYGPDRVEEVRVFGGGSGTGPFNRLAALPPSMARRPRVGPPRLQGPLASQDAGDEAELDAPALEQAALTHPDPEERASALSRLSELDEGRTREVALAILDRDQNVQVLREALNLLEMQDQLPRERLMRFVAAPRPAEARIQALDMLADSGTNDAAFRRLVSTLAKDQNDEVRQRALEILEDLEGESEQGRNVRPPPPR